MENRKDINVYSLFELAKYRRGSFPQPYGLDKWYDDENGKPFVQVYDVNDNFRLKEQTKRRISKEAEGKSVFAPKGSLLITIQGSIGRLAMMQYGAYVDRTLLIFQSISKLVDKKYFMYSLYLLFKREAQRAPGGTIKTITKEKLSDFQIKLPPLPEQRKIAEILSTWDESIETLEKLITAKEKLKKGLMQQLLTGKKRLPGFEGEWEIRRIEEVTTRVTRKNSTGIDNVVTISAQHGFVKQEDFFKKRVASSSLANYYLLKRGEFAYNKSYSNGYPMGAIKRQDIFDEAVVTTLYLCFSVNEDSLDPEFAEHFFESGALNRGLTKIAQEGARAHGLLSIGVNDFFSLKMNLPSLAEQAEIAAVLNRSREEIDLLNQILSLVKLQKKGLMQQLLTGKTRVKV